MSTGCQLLRPDSGWPYTVLVISDTKGSPKISAEVDKMHINLHGFTHHDWLLFLFIILLCLCLFHHHHNNNHHHHHHHHHQWSVISQPRWDWLLICIPAGAQTLSWSIGVRGETEGEREWDSQQGKLGWINTYLYIWVFPKIRVPQNGWFIMETLLKWMIWGYHDFWKHPYIQIKILLIWSRNPNRVMVFSVFLTFRMSSYVPPWSHAWRVSKWICFFSNTKIAISSHGKMKSRLWSFARSTCDFSLRSFKFKIGIKL